MTLGQARWTPARWFLLAVLVTHLPLGIAGLIVDRSFPIGSAAARAGDSGHVFGVLETNGWHSMAALALAVIASWFVHKPSGARRVALGLGVFHVVLVVQLALWDPRNFWIASNAADQFVHASTALGGVISALMTPATSQGGAVLVPSKERS